MSALVAEPGPRLRVLGTTGSYIKRGMDIQEGGLREGLRPDESDWGNEPEERWGMLGDGTTSKRLRTETGGYQRFYAELGFQRTSGVYDDDGRVIWPASG